MDTPEYRIVDSKLWKMQDRIDKLNRRAVKLGVASVVVTELRIEDVPDKDFDEYGKMVPTGTVTRWHVLTVTAETPKLAGYELVGVIQHLHTEEGWLNIVRSVPGQPELDQAYRTAEPTCDQCHTKRNRIDTFLVRHEQGSIKRIGRNCLADFLGGVSPDAILAAAEILSNLGDLLNEYDGEGGGSSRGGSSRGDWITLKQLLTYTATVIRVDGWLSGTKAREFDKQPTSATVGYVMFSKCKMTREERAHYARTDEDSALADAAIAWAMTIPTDTAEDYLYNLRVLAGTEVLPRRSFNLACSMIAAYNRAMKKETKRKLQVSEWRNSEFVGTVGKREVFTLTLVSVFEIEGRFGLTTIHKFTDASKNLLVWFKSGSASLETGKTYKLKATVKAHETWRPRDVKDTDFPGIKQTIINRATLEPTKDQKKAQKTLQHALAAIREQLQSELVGGESRQHIYEAEIILDDCLKAVEAEIEAPEE